MRDKANNRYVAIITGLGYNAQSKRPLFPEQDMNFNLDVELTKNDFEIVSFLHKKQKKNHEIFKMFTFLDQ